jgi:hypothetical protein
MGESMITKAMGPMNKTWHVPVSRSKTITEEGVAIVTAPTPDMAVAAAKAAVAADQVEFQADAGDPEIGPVHCGKAQPA